MYAAWGSNVHSASLVTPEWGQSEQTSQIQMNVDAIALAGIQPERATSRENGANQLMTTYKRVQTLQAIIPVTSVQEAKAKRQALLERVRKQRAQGHKRQGRA